MQAQSRYQPNVQFDGRKERDGFVCAPGTTKYCTHCVAVKMDGGTIQIRDTKDESDTTLTFNSSEWSAFTDGVKAGQYDL